jgi:hypothetical protein
LLSLSNRAFKISFNPPVRMNSYLIIYTLNALYEFPMRLNSTTGPDID